MDGALPTWAGARLTARAPRVAVVVPDDAHWDFWFRTALHQTGQVWGGSFAAVVPQRGGVVSPALLSAVQAYDPDHVVALSVTDSVRAAVAGEPLPESRSAPGGTGERADTWVPRPELHRADEASLAARDSLRSTIPTFHQRLRGGPDAWLLPHLHVPVRRPGPLAPAAHPHRSDLDPSAFLSCPSTWSGPLAAAVTNRAGAAEAPDPGSEDRPDHDDDLSAVLAAWLLGDGSTDLPGELLHGPAARLSVRTAEQPHAHVLSQHGLVEVWTGLPGPGLLVCGPTAEHAALARLWRLVRGRAWWFPWPPERLGDERHWRAQAAVTARREELHREGEPLLVVGADHLVGTPRWPDPISAGEGERWLAPVVALAPSDLPWGGTARALAARGQYGVPHLLPVAVSDGTATCLAPVPPALLTDPVLADREDLQWVVDVQWDDGRTLPQRPLDAQALLADRHEVARTWVRPSRLGLSYASADHGLQLAGVLPVNLLAQPRPVMPGLERWLRSVVERRGMDVRPSEAGRRSRLLAALCGSREAYLDLLAGPLLLALGLVEEASGTTDDWFPSKEGHGVCLDTGAVISWAGLRATVAQADDDALRARVDAACAAGVLRRGLVLQCAECTEIQFARLEQLGQLWTCQRCDLRQPLRHSSWRHPLEEPSWFYDLHPVARRTLHERGDVPALLCAHWVRQAATAGRRAETVEEMELVEGRKRHVEVDVVAFDGVLRVAECKSSTVDLPTPREIAKKCLFADLVQADELVFATTEAVWPEAFRRRLVGEAGKYPWSPRGTPALRLVSGLSYGGGDVVEVEL